MLLQKKTKQNPLLGCLFMLLTLAGILVVCFLICTVVFQLNQAQQPSNGSIINLLFG